MSAAEQLEDARGNKAGLPDRPRAEPSPIEAQLTQTPAAGRAKLRPLLALAPYVARYRGRAFLAFIALTVAALTTLIVIPLVALGRWVRGLSRGAQDTLAEATAYASELVGAIRTVQAYTAEKLANARFGGEVEQAYGAARSSTKARAVLTAIIIFIVFSSVVMILWIGSHDVATGMITQGRVGTVQF